MATPCTAPSTVILDRFTITFVSVVYNPDGTSTWTYTITTRSGNALNTWFLQLCFPNGNCPVVPGSCIFTPVLSGTETCACVTNDPDFCEGAGPSPGTCNTSLSGIRFNNLHVGAGQTQTYTFTLNQQFTTELTCFGIRVNPGQGGNKCAQICGPSPDCNTICCLNVTQFEEPGRGVVL